MNQQQINQFEEPIFANYDQERYRILSSKVMFKINLSIEEFWTNFFLYTFKQAINADQDKLAEGKILNINDETSKIRSYLITEYEKDSIIEFSTLKNHLLNKIYLEVIPTKHAQEIKVIYIESRRDDKLITKKEHKKLLNQFNAKILNKVILLKQYLLKRVQ